MLSNPIFIIGTERSGSNLLRLLLDAHSKICIPHPPHILRDFAPIAHLYGDLRNEDRFKALVHDVVSVVNLHFAPWPFEIAESALLEKIEVRSLYGVYAALYGLYAENQGRARWGCKSTFMYRQIPEILQNHAEPRFLHLVRDPRDVAASAERSIFSRYHPYKQAQLWVEQQSSIEQQKEAAVPRVFLQVRYEDLVSSPESELRRIMIFLGEDYEPRQMEYFRGGEAARLSKLSESWKNCGKPVSKSSVGRFKDELNPEEIRWVEFRTQALMRKYGYIPLFPGAEEAPGFAARLKIEFIECWKMLGAETRSLLKDKNFSLRWRRRIYLRYLQATRSVMNG